MLKLLILFVKYLFILSFRLPQYWIISRLVEINVLTMRFLSSRFVLMNLWRESSRIFINWQMIFINSWPSIDIIINILMNFNQRHVLFNWRKLNLWLIPFFAMWIPNAITLKMYILAKTILRKHASIDLIG